MFADLIKAARVLRRSPMFALTVIATMAIGIGANAALFSLADTLYFKPLPLRDPDRLVTVFRANAAPNSNVFSYPLYRDVQERARAFDGLIVFSPIQVLVGTGESLTAVQGEIVSGNYFDVLGVGAARGRMLMPDDDRTPGAHAVAVISDGLWRSQFGTAPDVIGRSVLMNHRPYTIVGVAPRNFEGTVIGSGTDLWVPMAMQMQMRPPSAGSALQQGPDLLSRRTTGWLLAAGRLHEGATLESVTAELDVIAAQLRSEHPQIYREDWSLRAEPIVDQSGLRTSSRTLIGILFGVVGLVLVVACTNVAGLLVARTEERWHEISVRMAIGCSRARLVWHLVAEYLVLATLGGVAGLLVARAGTTLLRAWVVPPSLDLPLDWRVAAFTSILVIVTGTLISIWPALTAARTDVTDTLRGARTSTANRAIGRRMLVAVQLAVAVVLVVASGLALRTLWNVSRVDPGFRVNNIEIIPVDVRTLGFTLTTAQPFYDRVHAAVRGMPGIESVALARIVPFSGGNRLSGVRRPGDDPSDPRSGIGVAVNVVTPGFFQTLGLPMLAGRDFDAADNRSAPRVVVISRALARELGTQENVIGSELRAEGGVSVRIIGVVEDARYRSPRQLAGPTVFFPIAQQQELGMTLLVRTQTAGTRAAVISRLREIDPRLPLHDVTTMRDLLAARTRDDRMFAWVVTGLASVALALAVMGIYGVVSFMANQRRREVGVRMALGATSPSIVWTMMRQQAVFMTIGLVVGAVSAAGGGRALSARLFEVPALDLTTHLISVLIIAVVAILALWLPARRASRVDPVIVLRAE